MAREDATHIIFSLFREGRGVPYWVECGYSIHKPDGTVAAYHDRTPNGGSRTRYLHVPVGMKPPPLTAQRSRPKQQHQPDEDEDMRGFYDDPTEDDS
jgi:hypothetical protein